MRGDLGSSDCGSGICHLSKGEQLCSVRTLDNDLQGVLQGQGRTNEATMPLCPCILSHSRPRAQAHSVSGAREAGILHPREPHREWREEL